MTVKVLNDYYVKRKSKLMKDFSKHIKVAMDILKRKFSEAKINEIYNQMKKEYENIIPEIPYIGGTKNPFSTILVGCLSSLAMFRVLENEGFTLRDIGEFYYEFRDINNTIRKNSLEQIGKDPAQYPFEPSYIEWAKKQCEISKLRNYPDDWVMDYVEGDGKTFEWGFNFHECGVHKIFKRLNAEKFVPFFCLADFSEANILGFGFSRNQTLGFGAPMCDHRYIKNYKTPRGWPPDDLPEFDKNILP
ncbi:MAG: L-2-amino-thiazoline-4-carboxylic acid hydrolase, partial [Candidatus Hodarchaeota archaeon]